MIIAGNKMDLRLSNTPDEEFARSRHQIVSLLQRFKFVRQCIKCSAKTLLNVNDVFVKAQNAVLYPINPLYDLTEGKLTPDCKKALTRIFRIFDEDNDGLLSNRELNNFQSYCFRVSLTEGYLAGWKKVISKNNPSEAVVRDGKFTIFGFLAIFDVFICSDRLKIPLIILRTFGYDDELKLEVPSSVTSSASSWELTPSALHFLIQVFQQFSSKNKGLLFSDDVSSIFSILPYPPLPAWHPSRVDLFIDKCFSTPASCLVHDSTAINKATKEGDNKSPPNDSSIGPHLRKMSLFDWIGHWHMISSIAPSLTREELYRLGHVEDSQHDNISRLKQSTSTTSMDSLSGILPCKAIRAMLIGSQGCGKTAFLSALCHRDDIGDEGILHILETNPTITPRTTCMHVVIEDKKVNTQKNNGSKQVKNQLKNKRIITELILTEIPAFNPENDIESKLSSFINDKTNKLTQGFDLVVFLFDCNDKSSLSYATDIEKRLLTDEVPRVFFGSKYDQKEVDNDSSKSKHNESKKDGDKSLSTVMEICNQHCKDLDLERPLYVSFSRNAISNGSLKSTNTRLKILEYMARCALPSYDPNRLRSRPHAEQKRREAEKRRKILWFGGLMSAGVAIIIGVGIFFRQKEERNGKMDWFKSSSAKVENKINSKEI